MADATKEVAEIISPHFTGWTISRAPASSLTAASSSKGPRLGASKASSRGRSHSSSRSPPALKSKPSSVLASRELIAIEESAEEVPQGKDEVIPATGGVPREGDEVPTAVGGASEGGAEVVPAGRGIFVAKVKTKAISAAPHPKKSSANRGVGVQEATGKRASSSKAPDEVPAPKKACVSERPTPALPPTEKAKMPVEPLSSSP